MTRIRERTLEKVFLKQQCKGNDILGTNLVIAEVCRRTVASHPVNHFQSFSSFLVDEAEFCGNLNQEIIIHSGPPLLDGFTIGVEFLTTGFIFGNGLEEIDPVGFNSSPK